MATQNNKGNVIANKTVIANTVKQSHDTNANNKQIASSLAMTHARVPKLRFKEFKSEWEEKRLESQISSIDSGWSPQCEEYPSEEDEWGVLKTTSVVWDGFNPDANKKLPSKFEPRPELQVLANDILITRAGPTSRVGVSVHVDEVREKLMISDKLIRIKVLENCSSHFLAVLLGNRNAQKQLISKSSGLAESQTNISQKILLKTKLLLPSIKEQQKISNFLTAVDTKLQQLTTKKEKLDLYKKGVMQQLFSQQLRFKEDDGSDFPDWEEKKLKEFISDFIVPMRDKPKDLAGEIPWCRIEDFDGKFLSKSKSNQGVSIETVKEMNLKVYPINTLLVSCSANLGFCAIVKKELITNQTFIGLVPNSDKVDVDYLFHIMKLSSRRLNVLSSGTTISYLSRKQFENFKIKYPSLKEQQKIANYLSVIDLKIEAIQTQITNTQQFKKGLLQQMFV